MVGILGIPHCCSELCRVRGHEFALTRRVARLGPVGVAIEEGLILGFFFVAPRTIFLLLSRVALALALAFSFVILALSVPLGGFKLLIFRFEGDICL